MRHMSERIVLQVLQANPHFMLRLWKGRAKPTKNDRFMESRRIEERIAKVTFTVMLCYIL
jgi:hypothetical protein